MSNKTTPELVVLTGAGFSKAFGLLLAKEFNEKLFNKLSDSDLSNLLGKKKNFEIVYGMLGGDMRKKFHDAVIEVFELMEEPSKNVKSPLKENFRNYFIKKYFESNERLDVFTLNQDVLVESGDLFQFRNAAVKDGIDFFYPGVMQVCKVNPTHYHKTEQDIVKDDFHNIIKNKVLIDPKMDYQREYSSQVELTYKDEFDSVFKVNKKLFYWKLHGSINWKKDGNGKYLMILGTDKEEQYQEYELIKFYLDQFEETIKGKNLLVVGYGFGDQGINNIIFESARNDNTIIHILDPNARLDSEMYEGQLRNRKNIKLYPYTLDQFFSFTIPEFPIGLIELYKSLNMSL